MNEAGSSSPWERLQRWYLAQCDEEWEHSFGVRIETLDNPGWLVKIDLVDTSWGDIRLAQEQVHRSDQDWVSTEVTDHVFVGAGGPLNLEEIVLRFLSLVGA